MPSPPASLHVLFCLLAILLPLVASQNGQSGSSDSNGTTGSPSSGGSYDYKQTASFKKSSRILITHAVFGTLTWALFAPLGAIILRLNIPGVNLLRFHIVIQLFVYGMTIVTTGLGIWLAIGASKYSGVWTDGHIVIGLLVFSAASIQPWLGYIHHLIFKRRLIDFKKGTHTKKPGRTAITVSHIWIGRILILLGVINGGLGIRLAAGTPYQTAATTRKAKIAYGILAGSVFLLFAGVGFIFEYRRSARLRAGHTTQQLPARSGSRGHAASEPNTPISPISSEQGTSFEEKSSEIGR